MDAEEHVQELDEDQTGEANCGHQVEGARFEHDHDQDHYDGALVNRDEVPVNESVQVQLAP